jgi:polar amino acid transport system substrate-binding protein
MRVNKTLAAVASVAALALALAGCAGSSAPSAPASAATPAVDYKLVSAGTLTVCSDIPYAPFEVEDAETASGYSGFDIDIISSVAEKLGLQLKVKVIGFDALKSGTALAAGQCDVAASAMTITDERKKNIDFSDAYYDSLQSLLVKKDSGIQDLAGLAGKKIGVQTGTTGKDYATANAPADAKLVDFDNDGLLWSAIQAGQIDAILQDLPVNQVHEKADAKYVIVAKYQTDEKYGFAFAKGKNPALLEVVNKQLAALHADGGYDKIYAKYFG